MMRGLTVIRRRGTLFTALALLLVAISAAHARPITPITIPDPATGQPVECAAGEVFVWFEDTVSPADAERIRLAIGCESMRAVQGSSAAVMFTPAGGDLGAAFAAAARQPGVRWAGPNFIWRLDQSTPQPFTPNDLGYGLAYAFPLCNIDDAWGAIATNQADPASPVMGDASIIVGIVDSGLSINHPDLKANVFVNPGEVPGDGIDNDANGYVDDVNGYDFGDGDADVVPGGDPLIDHGTMVAGCIGAVGNNSIGVPGMIWSLQMMSAKVCPDGVGGATVDVILEGFNYCVAMGADVVNISMGGPGLSPPFKSAVMTAFTAGPDLHGINPDRNGVNIVCAAGNDATDMTAVPYGPVMDESEANEIIGVAAVDLNAQAAVFTNYGRGVDIAAPGVACYTTAHPDTYASVDGTSFSSPYTAGFVALMRWLAPTLSSAEIRDIVLAAADEDTLYAVNPNFAPDMGLGQGLLEGYLAVRIVSEAPPDIAIATPTAGSVLVNTTPLIQLTAKKAYTSAPNLRQLIIEIDQDRDPDTSDVTTPGREAVVWVAEDPTVGAPSVTADEASYVVDPPLPVGDSGTALHTLRVRCADISGREAFFPPIGQEYRFRVSVESILAGVRMLAFPLELGVGGSNSPNLARPSVVLGTPIGRPGDTIVARWDPSTSQYVRSDVAGEDNAYIRFLELGKAYWISAPTDLGRLSLRGRDTNEEIEYIDGPRTTTSTGGLLATGWHQMGTPFAFPLALTSCLVQLESGELLPLEVAVTRSAVRGTIFRYLEEIGRYVPETIPDAIMMPMEGYWFRTLEPVRLFLEPAPATVGVRSESAAYSLTRVTGGWAAQLSAHVGAYGDTENAFGVASGGSDEYDEGLDLESPPPLSSKVDLCFPHPEWKQGASALSRDIAGDADRVKWPVQITTTVPNSDVTITWGDLRAAPRDVALYLVDKETDKTVSMRSAGSYTFRSGETGAKRTLEVRAEKRGVGGLLTVELLPAKVTRDGAAAVSFRLSQPADVDCVIRNAAGRVIRTVTQGETMDSGLRNLVWDGRSDAGATVPRGLYIVEITARTEQMEQARATRTLNR